METTEVKASWDEQKARLKQRFPVLTDEDLMFDEGRRAEMLARLKIKLRKTKEELHKIMKGL